MIMSVEVFVKKKREKIEGWNMIASYVYIFLLLALLIGGLEKTYEKGFIEGMMALCDDDLGYDMVNNEYVCYNKTEYKQQYYYNYDYNNVSWGAIE